MRGATLIDNELCMVISGDEVCSKASAVFDMLVYGGADPAGLCYEDFIPIVMKMKITEFAHDAIDYGITIQDSRWASVANGGAEIIFSFNRPADTVMSRMWLT
jgi:hypothetical protein